MEKSKLQELFIGVAVYINLASPEKESLPLKAFARTKGNSERKRATLTNKVMIKATVIIADYQKGK